uniref:Uncharacterized protein n=1 Tax=Arundo donax TaxID=35708 RepID=A0A0A9DEK8_ARUDO
MQQNQMMIRNTLWPVHTWQHINRWRPLNQRRTYHDHILLHLRATPDELQQPLLSAECCLLQLYLTCHSSMRHRLLPAPGEWCPSVVGGAEEDLDDVAGEDLEDAGVGPSHAPRRLELANRGAEGEVVAQHLLERAPLQHPQLQRRDSARLPRPDVAGVGERPVQLVAAALQHVVVGLRVELPEDDVVARVARHVGVAAVIDHLQLLGGEDLGRAIDGELQVMFAVLVDVDGQHQVPTAHELELGRRVVEPGHLHHVAQPVTIQSCEGGHENLVVLADGDLRQANGLRLRVARVGSGSAVAGLERDELEVGDVWEHGERG